MIYLSYNFVSQMIENYDNDERDVNILNDIMSSVTLSRIPNSHRLPRRLVAISYGQRTGASTVSGNLLASRISRFMCRALWPFASRITP